jgi:hypothetical protein
MREKRFIKLRAGLFQSEENLTGKTIFVIPENLKYK